MGGQNVLGRNLFRAGTIMPTFPARLCIEAQEKIGLWPRKVPFRAGQSHLIFFMGGIAVGPRGAVRPQPDFEQLLLKKALYSFKCDCPAF